MEERNPNLIQGRLLMSPAKSPEPGWIRLENGRISQLGFGDLPSNYGPPDLGGREYIICPAFIDAHLHVPQIDSIGCDGLPLLEWLDKVIYPAESWWGRGAATPATRTAVRRMLRHGTGGFAGYLTSHDEAAAESVSILSRTPLRFHVGRVAMDRHAPDSLVKSDQDRAARRPIPSPVMPSLGADLRRAISANPRFAISCSDELLAEIGWAVKELAKLGTPPFIQTHLAESAAECRQIAALFPSDSSYTAVYDRFGLLTDRTLLAHCVHLSVEEWALIAARRSIVVHCPAANIFLRSGLFNLDRARDHGIRLALGSDVAAGSDIAMPRVARCMIETAKARSMLAGGVHIPTPTEVWEMITRGNADLLGWSDSGRLEVGAAADLLMLRVPELWHDEHLIGRLIYNWSGELIQHCILDGHEVHADTIWSSRIS